MARYDSNSTEADGQYPTTAWSQMGLPEQNFGSGAPGGGQPSTLQDDGSTNEPGQYPAREDFTGVTLGGTGAPGGTSVGRADEGGPDTVTYSRVTLYKGEQESTEAGAIQETATGAVSGEADWTQANEKSYGPGFNLPGVEGNTPTPGSGQYQTGRGDVMYGGFLKGERPSTSKHPSFSGPGT